MSAPIFHQIASIIIIVCSIVKERQEKKSTKSKSPVSSIKLATKSIQNGVNRMIMSESHSDLCFIAFFNYYYHYLLLIMYFRFDNRSEICSSKFYIEFNCLLSPFLSLIFAIWFFAVPTNFNTISSVLHQKCTRRTSNRFDSVFAL